MSDFQISIITKTRKKHASLNYVNLAKIVEESVKKTETPKGSYGRESHEQKLATA